MFSRPGWQRPAPRTHPPPTPPAEGANAPGGGRSVPSAVLEQGVGVAGGQPPSSWTHVRRWAGEQLSPTRSPEGAENPEKLGQRRRVNSGLSRDQAPARLPILPRSPEERLGGTGLNKHQHPPARFRPGCPEGPPLTPRHGKRPRHRGTRRLPRGPGSPHLPVGTEVGEWTPGGFVHTCQCCQ